jgi:membrane-associated protease RseP (regulator of RpoE activity)
MGIESGTSDCMFDTPNVEERLLRSVRNVMTVEEITSGGAEGNVAARFKGRLIMDSEEAYEQLNAAFSREEMTVLFRSEGGQDVILAVRGVIRPEPSNPWINLILFLVTLLSVLFAGVIYGAEDTSLIDQHGLIKGIFLSLPQGIPFAASILAILLAHEFGHYLAARYHQTPVTLPYFIPFPGGILGTMGAFIRLKAPPKNRKVLLDIGLAGPLAGFIVAIPILLFGLSISEVGSLPSSQAAMAGTTLEGNSILYLAAKYLVKGELLPAPVSYGGMDPVLYWIRYFFLGQPTPFSGQDVLLHPVAWAGWAGLLVTALNLIPAGQLDGGHVIFVLFGRAARRIWPVIVIILLALGTVWTGWFIWAALIFFLGRAFAQPLDDITRLDTRRRWLAILGLIIFVLVFIPVPLRGFFG